MKINNNKGEVITLITIGTLIILGLASLVSSVFLKKPQTTKTKAQAANCVSEGGGWAEPEGIPCCGGLVRSDDGTTCVKPENKSKTLTYSGSKCECVNGQPSSAYYCGDTNPCGPEGGSCSDKGYGDWKNDCTGSAENCPADAGVTYTYWCDGSKWRFQYPNCTTWCKPAYLTQAPTQPPSGPCSGKSAGEILQSQQPPSSRTDILSGSQTEPKLDSSKYYSCDGNQGVWVNMNAFCDQFGQIQWGPGSKTDKVCAPPDLSISKAPGAFTLNLNVYVTKTANGFDFTNEAKIYSNDCDGDIRFSRDGAFVNLTGWNRKNQGDTFTWPKDYLGVVSIAAGNSQNITFEAALLKCPRSNVPITDTAICNFGVSPYGIPWVRGAGCTLANYSDVQKITPLPTPKLQPRVTWAPPPTPKVTVAPVIFGPSPKGGGSTMPGCQSTPGTYRFTDGNCYQCRYPFDNNPTKVTCPATAPPVITPLAPPSATSKCVSRFNTKVDCPSSKTSGTIKEYVSCPYSGKENDLCIVMCVDPTKNERVECFPSAGFPDNPSNPIFGYQVIFINLMNQPITIKRIAIRHTRLGLDTSWVFQNYNDTIQPNQLKIYSGSEPCFLGGGRHIAYTYQVGTDPAIITPQNFVDAGCKERVAIEIK